jgi:hypothetical protein
MRLEHIALVHKNTGEAIAGALIIHKHARTYRIQAYSVDREATLKAMPV